MRFEGFLRSPNRTLDKAFFAYFLSRKKVGGGDSRDRTGDLLLARQALSQLSYIPSYLASGPVPSKLNNVTSYFDQLT